MITNTGTIVATGLVGAAVEMHGEYGTLLNSGTLRAPAEADALRTGADSYGTEIVNTGIIDGRIRSHGEEPDKRFENSGWIGVTGNGIPITDLIGGTFVQTSAGTFAVRMTDTGNDALGVTGVARLAGTLQASFQTRNFAASYTLVGATQEITGAFETLTTTGLPALFDATLDYTPTTVTLNLAADLAGLPNITPNQRAVGGAIDGFINTTTNNMLTSLPDSLAPLYDLSAGQLPGALTAVSRRGLCQRALGADRRQPLCRQALLSRTAPGLMHQGNGSDTAALAFGGPALAYAPGTPQPAGINAPRLRDQGLGGGAAAGLRRHRVRATGLRRLDQPRRRRQRVARQRDDRRRRGRHRRPRRQLAARRRARLIPSRMPMSTPWRVRRGQQPAAGALRRHQFRPVEPAPRRQLCVQPDRCRPDHRLSRLLGAGERGL